MFGKKNLSTHPHHQSKRLWKSHKRGWVALLTLLLMATTLVQENAQYLQLSVLTAPEHAPFDGTVMPIQQVPDWLNASGDEQDMYFTDFPENKLIDAPSYDPDRLSIDSSTLQWGDTYDDYTRQMIITYPVVYAGTYQLDGIEGLGSHPAVDIKTVKGTPVYATMNGIADKVQYSNSGFGNLIVLQHNDVPDPDNDYAETTLYSGYAHLDTILIAEGDVVTKGQMIGRVGDTGTATTDHLHFQIDNSDAPWHLYWPFTTTESNAVGGFFEAVNEGLGKDNVYAYTENPMDYVQEYLDGEAELTVVEDAEEEEEIIEDEAPVVDVEVTDVVVEEEEEEIVVDNGPVFDDLDFEVSTLMELGQRQAVVVSLIDERGELVIAPDLVGSIMAYSSNEEVIRLTKDEMTKAEFANGEADIELYAKGSGSAMITLEYDGTIYTVGTVYVTTQLKPLSTFAIEVDDADFYVGEAVPIAVVALNEDNERIANFDLSEPLEFEVLQGEGYFSREALTENDFIDGVASLTFTPVSDEDLLLRVYSGDLDGTSQLLSSRLFADLSNENDYYQAILYLKSTGVIQGYDDSTFRPDNPVSRVEILKMLYEAFVKEVVSGAGLSFPDTDAAAWYAPYVATAQRDGIVRGDDGTGNFRPADAVNRVEAIKILTLALGVDIDPVVIGNPFEDVHYLEWYAPYAQFADQTNILPWTDDVLLPSEPMTRGEVAEMIYRVLAIQKNGADSYSRTLVLN